MPTALPIRARITPLGIRPGLQIVSLHGWTGWIPSLTTTPDRYRRLGDVGSGSQSTGLQAATVTCLAWRAEVSIADAIATIAAIELLQNEVVRILDDWGRTLQRCRIWRAAATPTKTRGPVVTGSATATHRVTISIDVERLQDV